MALGWLTQCNFKPPMIAIAVNLSNQSCNGILDNDEFSVNVPTKVIRLEKKLGMDYAIPNIYAEYPCLKPQPLYQEVIK